MATEMSIGQLAKQRGVNVQTVRYYERRNLLPPTSRMPSGYRRYGDEALRRLRFIRNAQALGFTLQEIAELLSLRISSTTRCGDVLEKAQVKLAQVEIKVQALQAMAEALRQLMRACREGLPTDRCPILQCLEQDSKPDADGIPVSSARPRVRSSGSSRKRGG